MHINDINLVT